jgi:short-subunit dehydrogenase
MSVRELDRVVAINLCSVLYGTSAVLPVMMRQQSGCIVNTASVLGLVPMPSQSVYAATKHAVVGFTTSMNIEARAFGVRMSVVCPGLVNTLIRENSASILREQSDIVLSPRSNRTLSAERCAQIILRDVARGKEIIHVAHSRALWWCYRLSPSLFRLFLTPLIRRKMGHQQTSLIAGVYSRVMHWLVRFVRTGRIR